MCAFTAYTKAKRLWRRMREKPTRRTRRVLRRAGKHKGRHVPKPGRTHYYTELLQDSGVQAYFAGKGGRWRKHEYTMRWQRFFSERASRPTCPALVAEAANTLPGSVPSLTPQVPHTSQKPRKARGRAPNKCVWVYSCLTHHHTTGRPCSVQTNANGSFWAAMGVSTTGAIPTECTQSA